MPRDRYMTARQAARALGVSLSTLYAYVSRGLIRSEAAAEGSRQRRYYAEDIDRLLARREGRRNPEKLAQDALHWGAPVLDSAITLIAAGRLYYRGQDVQALSQQATVEEVAALIWTGEQDRAAKLFAQEVAPSARKYESMLLHLEVDGADLQPLHTLQVLLPVAAADDPGAYDLRPDAVASTGARILRLMASVAAGDVPERQPIARMLQRGWCPDDAGAEALLQTALTLCADHELNASSFAARVVASARATPYAVVSAGLSALQGTLHGGYIEQVEALCQEAGTPRQVRDVVEARLRRGERIPGFGHRLYPDGDPRAAWLLQAIDEGRPGALPELMRALIDAAADLIDDRPTIDFALVALAQALRLPPGAALTLFGLGRTIGWIGHAIEQYEINRMIRPRARYIGEQPPGE